jgi:methionyl-tRNA synthetase
MTEEITIEDFAKVDLRVARVVEAHAIEGADRLLRLVVDLGGETRQLVAGIKKSYLPESLVGKRIIVVANLKPAVLRGVESRGMLLAASTDEGPILATFEKEVAAGSKVK